MSSNLVEKTQEELRAFIRERPHATVHELLRDARKEMKSQWKILFDVEKARMGVDFSEANWKRAVLLHLAPPGRFLPGGDRVSQPVHICFKCALFIAVAPASCNPRAVCGKPNTSNHN